MEKRVKNRSIALAQAFILVISIISFTFIVESQTVSARDSPSLRTIPGGRSSDPFTKQMIDQLSKMSAEELYADYKDIDLKSENQDLKGTSAGMFDLHGYLALGGSMTLILGHMFYRKILLSVFRESLAESIMTSATANTFAIVFASVAAAFAGAQIAKLVIQLLGASTRNMAVADTGAWIGTAVGAAAGMTAALVLGLSSGPAGWIALAVAAQVVVIYQLFNHQLYSREVFTYNPGLWQPQKGGENCEKCNDLEYGCSEYQCHTFGTGCKLLNPDSEEQRCYWANEDDISPPIISPMENSLLSSDYSYVETEQGAKVLYKGGCLPPFKGVTFGITTSDAALCKYDTDKKTKMEDMVYSTNFGLVAYMKNHRVAMSNANFPSQFELKNLGLEFDNSDEQNIWFMCESINGYQTPAPFVISFCVDDTPDITPPEIIKTTPLNGAYSQSGLSSIKFSVTTDEPANCSWDFQDKPYSEMQYSMVNCSENIVDHRPVNSYNYGCSGTLTGLKDNVMNTFYIKCKDKPSLNESVPDQKEVRVEMKDSYVYELMGTGGLVLDKMLVNGEESGAILKDAVVPMDVKFEATTSQGAKGNGDAKCTYQKDGIGPKYEFQNEGSLEYSSTNTDILNLINGEYKYTIECHDLAGNTDSKEISFTVKADSVAPTVARAYKSSGQMKILTTEYANCYYGTDGCSYPIKEGKSLFTSNHLEHTTPWDADIDKYVKCEDKFGNAPGPAECSIVVRGYKA